MSWTLSVHMPGVPPVNLSRPAVPMEAFDQVQVVIEGGATNKAVEIQPAAAARVALLLVTADPYSSGLTFQVTDGGNKHWAGNVTLNEPQMFTGTAIGVLGVAPKVLKFTNGGTDPITVRVYVFRDTTP